MQRLKTTAGLLAGGLLCACAAVSPVADDDQAAPIVPSSLHLRQADPAATPSAAGAHLKYYGGPVLSKVQVHAVYWGSKVKYQSQLASFYDAITQSPYFDWLDEYATPTQHIGRGRFAGAYVDDKAPPGTTITDKQIEDELSRLMDAGELPPPGADDLYMVHFPPGVAIQQDDGSASCAVFCAYHYTFKRKGKDVFYGVVPDLGGACAEGCGNRTQLENTTAAASHEMIEAVTDAAVGLATSFAAPLAWYDEANGEIGDICVGQDASIAGYTVQTEWSNASGACIATRTSSCGCGARQCGDDGCGTSCGTCPGGESCSEDGKCEGSTGGCGETEPNDQPAQANALCSEGTIEGTISSATDVDWYTWTVPRRAHYTVTLSKLAADYDMALYHASASGRLTLVDTAADAHDRSDEHLSHRSTSGGTYLLKVFGVKGAHSTKPYEVSVAIK
jgi:hypothetical protein